MMRGSDWGLRRGILRASVLAAMIGAGVGLLWGWKAYGALDLGFMAPYVIGCAASFGLIAALGLLLWDRLQRRPVEATVASAAAAVHPAGVVTRKTEMVVFFLLAVVIWPFIAVGIVGSFGFLVWMWQMVFGPPGPPN